MFFGSTNIFSLLLHSLEALSERKIDLLFLHLYHHCSGLTGQETCGQCSGASLQYYMTNCASYLFNSLDIKSFLGVNAGRCREGIEVYRKY